MVGVRFTGPVIVHMNDEKLWASGHLVDRFVRTIAGQITRFSRDAAPLNKRNRKFPNAPPRGSLKAGISSSVQRRGKRVIGIITQSDAPYSVYVHQGTRPVIYSRGPGGQFGRASFRLPRNNFGPYKVVQKIRGQTANPFIYKGIAKVAARHESLAGIMRVGLETPRRR